MLLLSAVDGKPVNNSVDSTKPFLSLLAQTPHLSASLIFRCQCGYSRVWVAVASDQTMAL